MSSLVFWSMLVTSHLVAIILLAMPLGFAKSFLLVSVVGAVEFAFWQRGIVSDLLGDMGRTATAAVREANNWIERRSESSVDTEPDTPTPQPETRPRRSSMLEISLSETTTRSQVEERIPSRRPSADTFPRSRRRSSLNEAGAQLLSDGVGFYGPGTQLTLDRGTIVSPLVYATSRSLHGSFDSSLIDGSLPVATAGTPCAAELPYWPSYHDASPEQRSRYLDWLTSGRLDPNISVGYVFIYFYGLERRILIDGADHLAIAEELLRLRMIYSSSRSFRRYSTSLLWLILALSGQQQFIARGVFTRAIATTERWDEESLGRCLAYLHECSQPLSVDLAYIVAQNDSRSPSSIVIRRHDSLFRELFAKKYEQRFGAGMELRSAQRTKSVRYQPASGSLLNQISGSKSAALASLPDVLALSSQFKPLVEIWTECIEELRSYDKAHRLSAGEVTAAAFESLPADLRAGEHPEFDTWFNVWTENANSEGIPIVPVRRLGAIKGFPERSTLLKSQCYALLRTADCIGIGIEPDARLIGRNYRSDELVTMFFVEDGSSQDPAGYQAAAMLLQLGLLVAEADGTIDEDEVSHITRHLEDQFELAPSQMKRLDALRMFLLSTKPDVQGIFRKLRKQLGPQQRLLVGEYLVGVAAADQHISPAEVDTLRQVFRQLDLSPQRLDSIISPLTTAQPASGSHPNDVVKRETGFVLDRHAISRIMRDTKDVAAILHDAIEAGEDSDDEDAAQETIGRPAAVGLDQASSVISASCAPILGVAIETATSPEASSLSPRFRPFLDALCEQSKWPESAAKQMAREHQVMLGGAIEAINEWAQDRWGDWLIEEGDPIIVRRELLNRE